MLQQKSIDSNVVKKLVRKSPELSIISKDRELICYLILRSSIRVFMLLAAISESWDRMLLIEGL